MHKQKRIRNSRTSYHSYETFNKEDQVFVYLPVKKICTSAKLTPFWRGPYQIIGKLSKIRYKVNCGRNRNDQVIHCDRMKSCRQHILRGEIESIDYEAHFDENNGNVDLINDDEGDTEEVLNIPDGNIELSEDLDSRRIRRRPYRAKDYVFSCRMSNIK